MNFFKSNLDERRDLILNGNIVKTMLLLTIPTFMMSIVQFFIPFTDSLFVNNILGEKVAAAISYVNPAYNMLLALSQGIGVVAVSMIGQLNGKGDIKEAKKVSLQILILAFAIGVILIPFNLIFAKLLSIKANDEISYYVFYYLSWLSLIIPMQFMAAIFASIKNSIGESEAPFYRMSVLLTLKIIFNYIFLKIFKFNLSGTIIASFMAYFLTFIWMYYDLFIREYKFKLNIRDYKFNKKLIKEVLRLSIPAMLTFMSINLGFLLINFEIEKFGVLILSGVAISSQINSICFILPTCVATTVTTMISINISQKNIEKSKMIYKKGLKIGIIVGIFTVLIIFPLAKILTLLFTRDEFIIKIAVKSIQVNLMSVIFFAIFMISQAVYNALGRNVYPLIMSILRIWIFRYLFIIFTEKFLAYESIFYGNLFSNTLAAIIFYIIIKKSSFRSGVRYE